MTEAAPPAKPSGPRESPSRPKIRDPYADLLRDTRGLRREQAAAREAWFSGLSWERKEETLFELEMLMKGLVCYANPRNHPGPARKTPVIAIDFREELSVARQTIARVIALCRTLLGPKDRAYVFTRYLEMVMPDDPTRARLNRDAPVQESPEDSLLHLRHGLTMIGEVMDGVLRLERVPYRLFHSSLVIAQREIQRNAFFNPLIALEFRPEFDRIRSVDVLESIQSVESDATHRVVALSYLSCFRMLRYVNLIQQCAQDPAGVRRAYVLLAALRSDARSLIGYLKARVADILADGLERELLKVPAKEMAARYDELIVECQRIQNLRSTLEAIAASLRVEMRGIFEVRVPAAELAPAPADLARTLSVAMTGLREGLQTAVTQLASTLRGEVDPARVFEDVESRAIVGERLRRDVWMFAQVLRAFLAKARASSDAPDRWAGFSSFHFVREFLGYFRAMGYQLLRSSDYPHFDKFLLALEGLQDADFLEPTRLQSAIDECERFYRYLMETFERISQRTELQGHTFDKRAAAETLKLHLGN